MNFASAMSALLQAVDITQRRVLDEVHRPVTTAAVRGVIEAIVISMPSRYGSPPLPSSQFFSSTTRVFGTYSTNLNGPVPIATSVVCYCRVTNA
ncbi:MAG: hypothetical protein R2853_05265 [Thermomicrobiales bacterium]